MKKWIALLLAMVLVLSLCATAFAAKPTAKLYSSKYNGFKVKRGNTAVWIYKLNSGSYTRKSGVWRSRFIENQFDKYNNPICEFGDYVFTGKLNFRVRLYIPSSAKKGKYYNRFETYYRKNSSAKWKINTKKKSTWYIK